MCEFCNNIYSEEDILQNFNDPNYDGYFGTYYYLGKDDTNQTVLYSLTFADDDAYSSYDCLTINYCPMCGRKLSEE